MVVLKEFRIVMPYTVPEYKRGQRYSTARSSKEASKGADGIELVKKEPFTHEKSGTEGVYTKKIYHLDGYMPGWIKALLPASALRLEEEAWDAFPHCKTVIKSPFLGDKFSFIIESAHAPLDPNEPPKNPPVKPVSKSPFKSKKKKGPVGRETELPFWENILELDEKDLKKREVHIIDIAMDELADKQYRIDSEDPKKVGSQKTGRGPLPKDWQYDNYQKIVKKADGTFPLMCCYKLVTIKCNVFGLQNKVENYLINTELNIFTRFHKQLFCWTDDWYGLSKEEISEFEAKMFEEINKSIGESEKNAPPQEVVDPKDFDFSKLKIEDALLDEPEGEDKDEDEDDDDEEEKGKDGNVVQKNGPPEGPL